MLRRLSSRVNEGLSPFFPERRIILRSEASSRYLRVSPFGQFLAAAAIAVGVGWTGAATYLFADAAVRSASLEARLEAAEAERDERIAALTTRTKRLADAVSRERVRADAALNRLTDQHASLSDAVAAERQLASSLKAHRATLDSLSGEHDASMQVCEATANHMTALEVRLHQMERENASLNETVAKLNASLNAVATERDFASASTDELAAALEELNAEITEDAARRASMLSRLEDAAQLSLDGLETVFEKSGLEIEPIISEVRRKYSGEGGPFIPESAAPEAATPDEARIDALIGDLAKINLLRIATDRLPFAVPVRAPRFTSGFGSRRDPVNGRRAHHAGLDMAGARGTPVFATGQGEVVKASRVRGYGKVVRIRHSFGYETVYAHLDRIRVKVGDVVERGDRIGDMGNTGRSTGTHLHYEIRINGKAVNPSKYIEAARHVL